MKTSKWMLSQLVRAKNSIHHKESFFSMNQRLTVSQNTAQSDQTQQDKVPALFRPLQLRSVTLSNRIMVAPMCQYSAEDGLANDWHLVHLGSLASGGAALVMTEATAVEALGRISPQDLGLYSDEHMAPLARITSFIKAQGAIPAIQIAHA